MIKPTHENLEIFCGATYTKDFQFTDKASGDLIDISTWVFNSEIRSDNFRESELLGTFTIEIDTETSTITLTLSIAQTILLPSGYAFWDLFITIGDEVNPYIYGKVEISSTVTQVTV